MLFINVIIFGVVRPLYLGHGECPNWVHAMYIGSCPKSYVTPHNIIVLVEYHAITHNNYEEVHSNHQLNNQTDK